MCSFKFQLLLFCLMLYLILSSIFNLQEWMLFWLSGILYLSSTFLYLEKRKKRKKKKAAAQVQKEEFIRKRGKNESLPTLSPFKYFEHFTNINEWNGWRISWGQTEKNEISRNLTIIKKIRITTVTLEIHL